MVDSEDLDPLLGGRHLLLDLDRDHWKPVSLHVVVHEGDISPYPHASPH